jgi:hypothetical protein
MKKFSFRIFFIATFIIAILTTVSLLANWDFDYTRKDAELFWVILARSFWVFNWAFTLMVRLTGDNPSEQMLIPGIILNCLLDGLIVERLFSFRRKKQKSIQSGIYAKAKKIEPVK